jgi:hypothetical protein
VIDRLLPGKTYRWPAYRGSAGRFATAGAPSGAAGNFTTAGALRRSPPALTTERSLT